MDLTTAVHRRTATRGRPFPTSGRPDAVPTPASRLRWFVVAHSTSPQTVQGRRTEWPSSWAHAKQMGSDLTACGLNATSWPKLFNVAFPPPRTEVCPECASSLASG
jgi:hypothetical protein